MAWHMGHQPTGAGILDCWSLQLAGDVLRLEGAYATHRLDGNNPISGFIVPARFEGMSETADVLLRVWAEECSDDGLRRVEARIARFEELARVVCALLCPACGARMLVYMGKGDDERFVCGDAPFFCPGRRRVGDEVPEDEGRLLFLKRIAGELRMSRLE